MNKIEEQEVQAKKKQEEANVNFIKLADVFIAQANTECKNIDHQLVNASLLYASARFSSFITASMSESKEKFEENVDDAIKFYTEEFNKMLKEHMAQYSFVFDQKKDS
jgi:hypothetical protein